MPISIAIDVKFKRFRKSRAARFFDKIIDLPRPALSHHFAKLHVAELTPYDVSLFIDADSVIAGDLRPTLARVLAAPTGFVLQGYYVDASKDDRHNGKSSAAICAAFNLPRYLRSYAGVVGFRKQAGIRMFAATQDLIRRYPKLPAHLNVHPTDDEVYLGICANSIAVDLFSPHMPMLLALKDVTSSANRPSIVPGVWAEPPAYHWLMRYIDELHREVELPILPAQWAWDKKLYPGGSLWDRWRRLREARKIIDSKASPDE